MKPTAPPVRTHSIALQPETTFEAMVAERLRQSPWLVMSAALHTLALLLLWVLFPQTAKFAPALRIAFEPPTEIAAPPPPEPPKLPDTQPELVTEPVVVTETVVTEDESEALDNVESEANAKESAFDSDQWNATIGLTGGAGGPYGNRGSGPRGRGTGRPHHEQIAAGLEWLAAHQDPEGRWDCDHFMKHDNPSDGPICDGPGNAVHDVGVTGLALLAFLGDGSTMRSGPYKENIKKGVTWLRENQQENGLFGSNTSHDFIYDHAIAAYAMCEAFGLSDYKLLEKTAQNGINYLEQHRNPYSVWRYQPRDGDNDLSVTAWCIMAYESGQFFGLEASTTALKMCETFLDQVSDPKTGKHGYTKMGEPSSRKPGEHQARFPVEKGEALTAAGLFVRFFMGQNPKEQPVMKAAAERIGKKPPVWDDKGGAVDHYYWYYATYALFQMGGSDWTNWQKKLETAVVENQRMDAAQKNLLGSWDPIGVWGEDGGRVYSTAILVLTLQANYRYGKLVR